MNRRVVITGLGALTAVGEGAEALWQAALEGRSGVGRVRLGGEGGLDFPGAAIRNFAPEKFVLQRKALKVMARDIQLAVAAADLAAVDAGVKALRVERERFGIIVGSGVLNHELDELAYSVSQSLGADGKLDLLKFGSEGLSALFPLWLLKYLPNMPACHISILLDLQGPSNTLTTGPSAGLQAVCEAARIIRRGSADLMLAGGSESKLNPLGLSHYRMMGVLAGDEPGAACRPFDELSSGIVVGEGAGFLVLEEYDHAKKRGARIYAEISGFGVSSEEGQRIALETAVREARISAGEVDYVQSCGLGLAVDDRKEAEAILEVLSGAPPLVSASKPLLGFTGFSAGALDLILSTMAVRNGMIPPVYSEAVSGDRFGLRLVSGRPEKKNVRHAVTNAFGLGGQCVSVVTRQAEKN